MAQQQSITGIAGLTSKTWYPQPPVEWGRAGGSVATITLGSATGDNGTGSGTNGTVDNKPTSTDGNGDDNLRVDLTIASNVCTAITVDAAAAADGVGYRVGDKVTVTAGNAGTSTSVVGYVASLEYETPT